MYVDQQRVFACMIVDARRRERLVRLVRAYEITCLARLINARSRTTGSERDDATALRLLADVEGPVCYAVYAKPSHAVKIGRTVEFAKRWMKLETSSGMPVQPLAIWRCASSGDTGLREADLFTRYVASRTIGEWFTADDVVSDLQAIAAQLSPSSSARAIGSRATRR